MHIEIDDLDTTLTQVEESGGTVVKPKYVFPNVGWMATCADPDGNRFSLIQNDVTAQ